MCRLLNAGTHPPTRALGAVHLSAVDQLFQVLCDCAALNPDMDGDGTLVRVPLRSAR